MNRRTLAWVSVVVLVIALGAWWLSGEEVPQVAVPTPVVALAPVLVPEVAPPAEPIAEEELVVDAGQSVMAELEIEVVEKGQRQIGVRVELEGPGGHVGRPTDIMGLARFTVPEGSWRIIEPRRRYGTFESRPRITGRNLKEIELSARRSAMTPIEVRAPLTHFRIDWPELRQVRGRVLDRNGAPVADARITSRRTESESEQQVAKCDPNGDFVFETDVEQLFVRANTKRAQSTLHAVKLPGEVSLVVDPWTELEVGVVGVDVPVRVRVLHEGEFAVEGASNLSLLVPVGQLELVARGSARGTLFSGKASTTTTLEGPNAVTIVLAPAPPLRGRLVDRGGRPVAEVGVSVYESDLAMSLLKGGSVGEAIGGPSVVTDSSGEFSLVPSTLRSASPVFQLMVAAPWRTTRPTLLRIDEAPADIQIEQGP